MKKPSVVIDFKPVSDNIIVDVLNIQPRKETKSGIILGGTKDVPAEMVFEEHPYQGIVYACGPGFITEHGILKPMSVKPGDLIYMQRLPEGSNEMTLINGKVYGRIREGLLLAVVEHEPVKEEPQVIN